MTEAGEKTKFPTPNCPRCRSERFAQHTAMDKPPSSQTLLGGAYFAKVYFLACAACGCIVGTFAEPSSLYWRGP